MSISTPAIAVPTLAIAIAASQPLAVTAEQKQMLMNTLAKGATEHEFGLYLQLAGAYNLDPFAREIWCVKLKAGEPALIMAGRDGYLKAAQRDPAFRGLSAGAVRENDEFEFDAGSGTVKHRFAGGGKRGQLIGAWAVAKHANRDPVARYVEYSEYKKGHGAWTTYPSAMIEKVAEVICLKRQFGLHGLVSREELDNGAIDIQYEIVPPTGEVSRGQLVADTAHANPRIKTREDLDVVRGMAQRNAAGDTAPLEELTDEEFFAFIEAIAAFKGAGA